MYNIEHVDYQIAHARVLLWGKWHLDTSNYLLHYAGDETYLSSFQVLRVRKISEIKIVISFSGNRKNISSILPTIGISSSIIR